MLYIYTLWIYDVRLTVLVSCEDNETKTFRRAERLTGL